MIAPYTGTVVDCYAGYRGEEEPRRFAYAGRRLEIVEILDRWLDPGYRYFKVRAENDGVYILRHDADSGVWEMKAEIAKRD